MRLSKVVTGRDEGMNLVEKPFVFCARFGFLFEVGFLGEVGEAGAVE